MQQSEGKPLLPGPKSQDRLVCSCGNVERIYIRQAQHSSVVASQRCGRAFPTHWRFQPSISRRSSWSRLRNLRAPPGAWRNLSSWPGRGFYRDGRSRVGQENRSGRGIGCECRPREHTLIPKKRQGDPEMSAQPQECHCTSKASNSRRSSNSTRLRSLSELPCLRMLQGIGQSR